jgi:uridylate kinase
VVLKLSGEALGEPGRGGIDVEVVHQLAIEINDVCKNLGVSVAVVPGGGNLWRGARGAAEGMDHTQSDHIGMLGTVMNALALQDALERIGQDTRVQTALEMPRVAEAYVRRRAMRHLEKGRVVIFAAGTGNPFFTTDTAAALRAAEIDAEVILKGTHSGVEGVYSADPKKDPAATLYDRLSFAEVMAKDLKVMDSTAIAFCRDNQIPIVVFDLLKAGNLRSILEGKPIGTLVG